MKYTWKKRKNDGYNCSNLYCGDIKIGGYAHEIWNNPQGLYKMSIFLPGVKSYNSDDVEWLKSSAISICKGWFIQAMNEDL
jgi:hypothetical protein